MLGLRGAARVKTVLFILFITAVGAFKIELLAVSHVFDGNKCSYFLQ